MSSFEEVLTFYDGTITIHYNHGLHSYTRVEADGGRVLIPGSTTVLDVINKPALPQWATNSTVQWLLQNVSLEDSRKAELLEIYEVVKAKGIPVENGSVITIGFNEFCALLQQARFNFRNIKEDAGDVGHAAHTWLEEFINGILEGKLTLDSEEPLPAEPRAASCVSAALAWMRKHLFKPIASEAKIYSLEYDYSGTYDWTAFITGCGDPDCCEFSGVARALGDFKSSNGLWDEYIAQIASYWRAREEEFPGEPIDIAVLLHLGKENGEFKAKLVTREDADSAFQAFVGALMIYNWGKQIKLDAKAERAEDRAAAKLEKARLKALEPKKPRAPRKVKIKSAGLIPVEGQEAA